MPGWLQNATTQAEVKVFILDRLYESLPRPPFTDAETEETRNCRQDGCDDFRVHFPCRSVAGLTDISRQFLDGVYAIGR